MNPMEFVLVVLFMIFMFSFLKNKSKARNRWEQPNEDSQETLRLREEVADLKERLKVLERITVDKENSLSRQIEELRDR